MTVPYEIRLTRQALKDLEKLTPKLREKVKNLCLAILRENPHEGKRLVGDLKESFSLRVSYQDRLVYSIDDQRRIVYVERCRTHYGD